jgi:hypothetical protein
MVIAPAALVRRCGRETNRKVVVTAIASGLAGYVWAR